VHPNQGLFFNSNLQPYSLTSSSLNLQAMIGFRVESKVEIMARGTLEKFNTM
jgi:hypothetical protein